MPFESVPANPIHMLWPNPACVNDHTTSYESVPLRASTAHRPRRDMSGKEAE